MQKRYTFRLPQGGKAYDWENDRIFIKLGAKDTGSAFTLVEDNLKSTFSLGLHLHRNHAETFYILEGSVDFFVDGDWMTAEVGTCLHIPQGIPHAAKISDGLKSARMLMIFQPSGFDGFLAELATMTEKEFADREKMTMLQEKYDVVQIGPWPNRE